MSTLHLIVEHMYAYINCYKNLIYIRSKSDPGIEATKVYLMRAVCMYLLATDASRVQKLRYG